jgi:hypothetical protein
MKQFVITHEESWEGEWVWPDPEFEETNKINPRTGNLQRRCLSLPERCKKCAAKYRRKLRMRKRVEKIIDICSEQDKKYSRPKLLTFAYPVQTSPSYQDRFGLIDEMKLLLPKALKILDKHGVIGGTYVIECTSRLANLDVYTEGFMQWKHHPHVHMVGVAPFIHPTKLDEWCQMLMPIGLGRIKYDAVKVKYINDEGHAEIDYSGRKKVSDYLIKYLVKNKTITRSFGVARKARVSIVQQ